MAHQTRHWGRFLQLLEQARVPLVALPQPLLWVRYAQVVVVVVAVLSVVMVMALLKPAQGDLQC